MPKPILYEDEQRVLNYLAQQLSIKNWEDAECDSQANNV